MPAHLSKEELINSLETVSKDFKSYCTEISDNDFFHQPPVKWSIAQNVTHLISSARMTRLAYRLPKFIVRIYTGKPNRPSRTFDELVSKYNLKLEQGGKASGTYIPKPVSSTAGKEKVITHFSMTMDRLMLSINKKWKDDQLDQYLAPHPLLGRITLRELAYFTIYHTQHHQNIIRERLSD